MDLLQPSVSDIEAARARIAGLALRTPLIPLNDCNGRIYLKLENLQPVGSFKIRCAASALFALDPSTTRNGVITASAGNFAQGLGYAARTRNIPVKSYVPETAAASKLTALRRYGVETVALPYQDWWAILEDPAAAGFGAEFIHPVASTEVIAGNATIGLELLEDLPDLATIIVPFGGGGLAVGIASAVKAQKPQVRVFAAETTAGAPVAAALAAGCPTVVPFDSSTFVTGVGSKRVLDTMWPLTRALLDGSWIASVEDTARMVRRLFERHHIVVEGAGATAVAAALSHIDPTATEPVVCVVSGGHLDFRHLEKIMTSQQL